MDIIQAAPRYTPQSTDLLTYEQKSAVYNLQAALHSGVEIVALAGPAGSGKTTLIKQLQKEMGQGVVISAMTNKASDVLRGKGLPGAMTVYKACLIPKLHEPGETLNAYLNMEEPIGSDQEEWLCQHFEYAKLQQAAIEAKSDMNQAMLTLGIEDFFGTYFHEWGPKPRQPGVLIIDEASMLGGKVLSTIRETFSKIILVGDDFQLAPIKDDPVFWCDKTVEYRFQLKEIHRQESDSQPLKLADCLREGRYVPIEDEADINVDLCAKGVPVIVYNNDLRIKLTKEIRYARGFIGSSPWIGEMLVCRENRKIDGFDFIKNSMLKVIATNGGDGCILEDSDGRRTQKFVNVRVEEYEKGSGLNCRYAYVLTCHSAQGSEWPEVMIVSKDARRLLAQKTIEGRKWIYTAVTRARNKVIWVNPIVMNPAQHAQQKLNLFSNYRFGKRDLTA